MWWHLTKGWKTGCTIRYHRLLLVLITFYASPTLFLDLAIIQGFPQISKYSSRFVLARSDKWILTRRDINQLRLFSCARRGGHLRFSRFCFCFCSCEIRRIDRFPVSEINYSATEDKRIWHSRIVRRTFVPSGMTRCWFPSCRCNRIVFFFLCGVTYDVCSQRRRRDGNEARPDAIMGWYGISAPDSLQPVFHPDSQAFLEVGWGIDLTGQGRDI